jgi:hypothetical protein
MHVRAQAEAVAAELLEGRLRMERSKSRIVETRRTIENGWHASIDRLRSQGELELAASVDRFVDEMPPPATDREIVALALVGCARPPELSRVLYER